jgi:hypothetical protein
MRLDRILKTLRECTDAAPELSARTLANRGGSGNLSADMKRTR